MAWQVLIAHATGEENLAEQLAKPIQEAGYEVFHGGSILVGESIPEETSKVLSLGGPVVLCGTIRAMGTKWAKRVVFAARPNNRNLRIFCVQMEEEADVESISLDGTIAQYWQDPAKAMANLIAALQKYYPLEADEQAELAIHEAEHRYRQLALQSCDILDLANLPQSDRHIATRQLELRRLFVTLRVRVEKPSDSDERIVSDFAQGKQEATFVDNRDTTSSDRSRVPIGERLAVSQTLVVLGDPGSGKTTLLRWIASAYLLRLNRDPDWKDLPDVKTLPDRDWLPVIIRCRDLNETALDGSLNDILSQTLRKAEMTAKDIESFQVILERKLLSGDALLLFDGLDEIADVVQRAKFSRQIEQIHIANSTVPIIVTSRTVGYREMRFRINRGFEHVTITDLTTKDKDDFARRWCQLTEPPERLEQATDELITYMHSDDRIKRLAGNPMLLTTIAMLKRGGKQLKRRTDIYNEAIYVLLNWRGEVDKALEAVEAIPQLEYIAYAMCERGTQQLTESEIIELFDKIRREYRPNYELRWHTSREFLKLLERRTGLLVEAGYKRRQGRPEPIYEFRHLTFQEYLAGLALVDRKFPGRNRQNSLAQDIALLTSKAVYAENLREAIRLCAACSNDEDVNDVFLAILNPYSSEEPEDTVQRRVLLAALCLSDEPHVSDQVVENIFNALMQQIKGNDGGGFGHSENQLFARTYIDKVILMLAETHWADLITKLLVIRFTEQNAPINYPSSGNVGGMASMVIAAQVIKQ